MKKNCKKINDVEGLFILGSHTKQMDRKFRKKAKRVVIYEHQKEEIIAEDDELDDFSQLLGIE